MYAYCLLFTVHAELFITEDMTVTIVVQGNVSCSAMGSAMVDTEWTVDAIVYGRCSAEDITNITGTLVPVYRDWPGHSASTLYI